MIRVLNNSSHKTSSVPSRLRFLFSLAIVFGMGFLVLILYNNIGIILHTHIIENLPRVNNIYKIEDDEDRFIIQTEGCSIPKLKTLSEDIKQYVEFPTSIKPCRNSEHPLLDSNRTHIWVNQNHKRYYNTTRYDHFICCYKSFNRPNFIDDISSVYVDDRVKYNRCVNFSKEVEVSDEFVKVECLNNGKIIYEQYFPFIVKKNIKISSPAINESAYNVLVVGIDGVSRLNFHRTMPKTLQFLRDKRAIELLGYNKVGDNTFPNIVPMLLGIKESELRHTCLPNQWSTFDNCPFIWQWFSQIGYYTAFAEDSSFLGTFNYQRSGFVKTPTNYYLHTFIHQAEKNTGNNKDFNTFLCMNEKYFYDVLLRYIEDLTATLNSDKLFGFFWESTISHDYLNYPMAMDNRYKTFFAGLDASNYLDNTIVFFVSDHGIRWGKMRSTKQGRLEERLPFVYVLLPQSFRHKYKEAYNNLKSNSKRLTTPFDIHATLYDLIDLGNIHSKTIRSRKLKPYSQNRSISLFLPISTHRTCKDADIDDHWCTCQISYNLSLNSTEALTAAAQLLRHLNEMLKNFRQCAFLKLTEVIEVSELIVGTPDRGEVGWREFMVVVRTDPGSAIFESTLRYDNQNWLVVGTVSRLNIYGEQSRCMGYYQLKLYCFCI